MTKLHSDISKRVAKTKLAKPQSAAKARAALPRGILVNARKEVRVKEVSGVSTVALKTREPSNSKPYEVHFLGVTVRELSDHPGVSGFDAEGSDFRSLYVMDLASRVHIVRSGLPASTLSRISDVMSVRLDKVCQWLTIPRSTAHRKISSQGVLSREESERALALERLLGQVETIVAESGTPEGFVAAKWLANWLDAPNGALGRQKPSEWLDTADGRELVSRLISQMQTGAYA